MPLSCAALDASLFDRKSRRTLWVQALTDRKAERLFPWETLIVYPRPSRNSCAKKGIEMRIEHSLPTGFLGRRRRPDPRECPTEEAGGRRERSDGRGMAESGLSRAVCTID